METPRPSTSACYTSENSIYFNVICFLLDSLGEGLWDRPANQRGLRSRNHDGPLLPAASGRRSARCPPRAGVMEGRKAERAPGLRDSGEWATGPPVGRPSDGPRGSAGVPSLVAAPGPAHPSAGSAGPREHPHAVVRPQKPTQPPGDRPGPHLLGPRRRHLPEGHLLPAPGRSGKRGRRGPSGGEAAGSPRDDSP